jgi:hypothetical protein
MSALSGFGERPGEPRQRQDPHVIPTGLGLYQGRPQEPDHRLRCRRDEIPRDRLPSRGQDGVDRGVSSALIVRPMIRKRPRVISRLPMRCLADEAGSLPNEKRRPRIYGAPRERKTKLPRRNTGIDSRRSPSVRPHSKFADGADGILTCACFIEETAIEPGTVNNGCMAYVG